MCHGGFFRRGIHICMRDFHQFLEQKTNEGLGSFLGLTPKPQAPMAAQKPTTPGPIDPQYFKYWTSLVVKHQGDQQAAYAEYQELLASPAGKYRMMRMNADYGNHRPDTKAAHPFDYSR
jgi:hypothetical protein